MCNDLIKIKLRVITTVNNVSVNSKIYNIFCSIRPVNKYD